MIEQIRNATTKSTTIQLGFIRHFNSVANNDTKSDELRRANNEVYVYREQS
jgi:hypothetical protein